MCLCLLLRVSVTDSETTESLSSTHQHPTGSISSTLVTLPGVKVGVPLAAPALKLGLPRRLSREESTCNAGDTGSIPGSGKCPGEVGGNPLQYACLKSGVYSPWGHRAVGNGFRN